ncbi:MAG: MFS transporter [Candidatus Brocadiae bacterium]|nr:MFS transporter [Candidatus Brocadiia bacterium]
MSTELYVRLSLMMFLQFAVWGAWSPVLAARLLGPLKMSGKQTGWIYGTIYLGCIVSPLVGGLVVDMYVATQWFLAGAHLIGGVLLLAARKTTFRGLFVTMCLYALAFAPTLALVNSLMFSHLTKPKEQAFGIMLWGVVAWVLVGWMLSAWRRAKGSGDGSDCLVLAGLLSLLMGLYCLTLPHTPPKAVDPLLKALSMLREPNFLLFLIVSFVVATQLQFYFLGTARYLGDLGVEDRNVPAVMTIAQAAQVLASVYMVFQGERVIRQIGFRWTLVLGAAFWLLMYVVYSLTRPRALVIASQALHGIAYAFFIGVGFIYVAQQAPPEILGSATGLYTVALFGFGLFLGTQFTGVVMDRYTQDGKFRWRPIFLVPCALTLASALVLAAFFRG